MGAHTEMKEIGELPPSINEITAAYYGSWNKLERNKWSGSQVL